MEGWRVISIVGGACGVALMGVTLWRLRREPRSPEVRQRRADAVAVLLFGAGVAPTGIQGTPVSANPAIYWIVMGLLLSSFVMLVVAEYGGKR